MYLAIIIVAFLIFIYFIDKKERKHDKKIKQENQPTTLKLYNPDDLDTKQSISIIDESSDLKLFY